MRKVLPSFFLTKRIGYIRKKWYKKFLSKSERNKNNTKIKAALLNGDDDFEFVKNKKTVLWRLW